MRGALSAAIVTILGRAHRTAVPAGGFPYCIPAVPRRNTEPRPQASAGGRSMGGAIRTAKDIVVILALAVAMGAATLAPARADLDKGMAAFEAGDYAAALAEFRADAATGDARAQYNLGVLYLTGKGVEADAAEAARWHRLAAEQGLAMAQHGLGVLYYRGDGVAQDRLEASRWFRKAADQGLARAQYNLGVMYFNGEGVQTNLVETIKWISLAAGQGFADAQFRLGAMYEEGKGLPKDAGEALKWFRAAAENGHDAAGTRARALAARHAAAARETLRGSGRSAAETPDAPPPGPDPKTREIAAPAGNDLVAALPPKPEPPPAPPSMDRDTIAPPPTDTPPPEESPAAASPEPPPPAAEVMDGSPPAAEPAEAAAPLPEPAPAPEPPPAAAARPEPGPPPAASPERKKPPGPWRVQFAAYRDRGAAESGWSRLRRRFAAALDPWRSPIIEKADLGPGRGVFHRLQAGPFESRTQAAGLCARIRKTAPDQSCLPVRKPDAPPPDAVGAAPGD
ncbi:MAG: hypothetical protein GEU92_17490 [Alphaproteobacteria bacterium]|nr:hypothetical protein [Alphaproteobacteria bacterium]